MAKIIFLAPEEPYTEFVGELQARAVDKINETSHDKHTYYIAKNFEDMQKNFHESGADLLIAGWERVPSLDKLSSGYAEFKFLRNLPLVIVRNVEHPEFEAMRTKNNFQYLDTVAIIPVKHYADPEVLRKIIDYTEEKLIKEGPAKGILRMQYLMVKLGYATAEI